jgi:hypothetical protein
MSPTDAVSAEDVGMDRREYDDRVQIVADFGAETEASVDVIDETVIVVTGEEQYELDVDGNAQASMANGVLTIEVNE